jgi:glycosyltransferase involved in cell wall biosynthesis
MRVALLITGLERGGAELQTVQLAKLLHARGWEVAVFALRMGPLAEELAAAGIPAARFHPLRLMRFRPHILHAHLFHANVAARLVRLFLPVPAVISTVHSLAESSRRSGRFRMRDLAYRLTDSLADRTVFVSTAAAERHVAAHAASAHRTRVIPNGVDTERFRPDPDQRARTRAALGIGDEFVWLAAGRLMWKKNYQLLLHAVERQLDAILLIAGTGPDEAELRAAAPSNVRFLGARGDLPALVNAADAFALSSSVEGLPMVLLEAAAGGLPCVATAVGGVAEAVLAERTGYLVPPGDAEALSAAMARLAVASAEERAAMGREARAYALARFDLRGVVDQWERLYRGLVAEEE